MTNDTVTLLAFQQVKTRPLSEEVEVVTLTILPDEEPAELELADFPAESSLVQNQPSLLLASDFALDHDLAAFDAPSHPLLHQEAPGQIARLTAWLHHEALPVQNELETYKDIVTGKRRLNHRRAVAAILGLTVTGLWAMQHIPAVGQVATLLLAGVNTANTIYRFSPMIRRFWAHAHHPSQQILAETNQQIVEQAGGLGLMILFPLLKNLVLPVTATLINPFLGMAVTSGLMIAERLASDEIHALSFPIGKELAQEEVALSGNDALLRATAQVQASHAQQEQVQRSLPMVDLESVWIEQDSPLSSSVPGLE